MPHGDARRRQGAEAEAPEVGRPAVGHPVNELGNVVGEALDRHGSAGVGRVAVALKLDPDHPAAVRQPWEHVAEAAIEGDDPTVKGDERRPVGVAVLLVPDRNAVDLLVRHRLMMSASAACCRGSDVHCRPMNRRRTAESYGHGQGADSHVHVAGRVRRPARRQPSGVVRLVLERRRRGAERAGEHELLGRRRERPDAAGAHVGLRRARSPAVGCSTRPTAGATTTPPARQWSS